MRSRYGPACLLVLTLALPAISYAQSTVVPAGMTEETNLRNVRYCEILVGKRHGSSWSCETLPEKPM
jgi:hypothetical protein